MSIFINSINMEEERPKSYWLVFILLIFLVTLGILVYYIRFKTSTTPKASSYNITSTVSISNSYVFSSPVRAKAGGDLIRVTVFLLDDTGNGIFDKKVTLRDINNDTAGTLQVKEIQSLTDETGKALFDIASSTVGVFNLEASTTDTTLPQKVKVTFD